MREHIVIVNPSVLAHALDRVDESLATPADMPVTTAAHGYEYGFASSSAVGVDNEDRLAPVVGRFAIGAAGCDICAAGCILYRMKKRFIRRW